MTKLITFLIMCLLAVFKPLQANTRTVEVLYLQIAQPQQATLSNLDPVPEDIGVVGAELAVADNNTTGKFLGYEYAVSFALLEEGDIAAANSALDQFEGDFVLLDMSAQEQLMLLASGSPKLFFNVRAYNDELRGASCQKNLFHTLPSYAMRADALLQFAVKKRWEDLVLLIGSTPEDASYAQAIRRSAKKFGLELKRDQNWIFDADMRRQASAEVPLFTQKLGDYQALIIADERNDFARYVRYNTWLPRPVMGGDGLRSQAWARSVEQWGAAQLQSRFRDLADRDMRDIDYAAWVALRSIDEALVRTKFAELDTVKAYLLDGIEVAGFKGRPLSYRQWNGQLRQPIALAHNSALVAMAPLEGFLHAHNELDSLGFDRPGNRCTNFEGGAQ
ncbi:MAG: ABC transporter substrate-binding protein [Granulosicoccaceae bacterium]